MNQELIDEVLSYSCIKQKVLSEDDPTLSRDVYVKNPEYFPKESGYVFPDSRFGFFDPLEKNWYFFKSNGYFGGYKNYGFEGVELPSHFSGGGFFSNTNGYYSKEQHNSILIAKDEEIIYGSLLEPIKDLSLLENFPRGLSPFCPRDRKEEFILLGGLYLYKRLYALWGQGGLPVGISKVTDAKELKEGISRRAKEIAFCKISFNKLAKYQKAFETALLQSHKLQTENIFVNMFNKGRDMSLPVAPVLMNGLFIPEEGWYFYDHPAYGIKPKAEFWKFLGDQKNLKFMERLPNKGDDGKMIFYHYDPSAAGLIIKVFLFGEFERTNEPKNIPPIDLFPAGFSEETISKPDDRTLCLLASQQGLMYALMARADGTVLGWERCISQQDIDEGGYLRIPHVRNFTEEEHLKDMVLDFRQRIGKIISL